MSKEKDKYIKITRRLDFTKKKNRGKVQQLLKLYGDVDKIPIEYLQSHTFEKYDPSKPHHQAAMENGK